MRLQLADQSSPPSKAGSGPTSGLSGAAQLAGREEATGFPGDGPIYSALPQLPEVESRGQAPTAGLARPVAAAPAGTYERVAQRLY